MPAVRPILLLTRPLAQSHAFAAAVEAALPGRFELVVSPLQSIELMPGRLELGGVDALAFTSANGVAAFAALGGVAAFAAPDATAPFTAPSGMSPGGAAVAAAAAASPRRDGGGLRSAFCVGETTAAAARAHGLPAVAAGGDAASLVRLIAHHRPGRVLHLRGEMIAANLVAALGKVGIAAREQVVYAQRRLAPSEEAERLGASGQLDILTAFSPNGARLLAEAAGRWDLGRVTTLAISPAADAALAGLAPARRRVAGAPARAAMLAALAQLA